MDRREFLKATAGTGLAASILSAAPIAAMGAEKCEPNKPASGCRKFAFFSNCCICPDRSNSKFVLADPAESIWDVLKTIRAKAEQLNAPLLSLTCLGIQRANPDMSVKDTVAKGRQNTDKPDMAFVGLNATAAEVEQALSCRQIYLERKGYSSPEENVQEDAVNVFLFNPNAARIVESLGDRHWLVFGRGFQQCGAASTVGLLALGKKVTVLEDAVLAVGGKWNTPGSFQRTVDYLKSLGAEFARSDEILGKA